MMPKFNGNIFSQQPIMRLFASGIWSRFPAIMQFFLSRAHASLYELGLSKWLIKPYVFLNYIDGPIYVSEFEPGSGAAKYKSFQDFFTRKIAIPRAIESKSVWPCDGLLCEAGHLPELGLVNIKGERRSVDQVFGPNFALPKTGFFANIFLHNCDYHRIHSPVSGEIVKIQHIPGELRFLRPWFYRQPSLPALTNERFNLEIRTQNDAGNFESWFLSIVGGPGVATIVLDSVVALGSFVAVGQELALFRLGSTCCLIAPQVITHRVGTKVRMGEAI